MAGHLLDAGHELVVFNRTRARADALVERGARWADSPGEAASMADVVITMVGYPADVEEVYLAQGGIVERAREGAVLVDMTTSSPALARRIAAAAAEAGRSIAALDAPVSGGDIGARNATLTIMVGGDADAFARVEPLFRVLGTNVVLQGGPGAGQHTKMANQVAIAGSMLATVESLAYARGGRARPAPSTRVDRCRLGGQLVARQPRSADPRWQLRSRLLREALREGPQDRAGLGRGSGHRASGLCDGEAALRAARIQWRRGPGHAGAVAALRRCRDALGGRRLRTRAPPARRLR